jgi:hypothetical protein
MEEEEKTTTNDSNNPPPKSADLAANHAANIQGLEDWVADMVENFPTETELAMADESGALPKNDDLRRQIESAGQKFSLAPGVVWERLRRKFKKSSHIKQKTIDALKKRANDIIDKYSAALERAAARRLHDLDDEAVEREDEESDIDAELEAEIAEAAEELGVDDKEVRRHLQAALREKHRQEQETTAGEKPPAEIPGKDRQRYGKFWVSSEPCGVWYHHHEATGLASFFEWRRCTKHRLDPICHSHDIDGKKPHTHLLHTIPGGARKEIEIDCRDIAIETSPNTAIKKVTHEGVRVIRRKEARAALIEYLNYHDPKYRRIRVTQTGWLEIENGRWAFILPEPFGTFMPKDLPRITKASKRNKKLKPDPKVDYVLDREVGAGAGLAIKGTLAEWQEKIAKPLEGNSNVAMALGIGFAAPLLLFAEAQPGGAHIDGTSSIGKTIASAVGQSLYGRPVGTVGNGPTFGRSWRSTGNGFEAFARVRNDLPMYLDELHLADAAEVRPCIYMISEGEGKTRMNSKLTMHELANFRTTLLSTGELSMKEFLKDDAEGRRKRVPDVPAAARPDGSALESVANGTDMVLAGKLYYGRWLANLYGAAGLAYLRALVDLGPNQIKEKIERYRDEFMELPEIKDLARGAGAQVASVIANFSLYAAADRLAVELGVLPWSLESCTRGIALALLRWAQRRGDLGVAGEIVTAAQRVREQVRGELAGYIHLRKARDGKVRRLMPARPEDAPNFANWRALLASGAVNGFVRLEEDDAIGNILIGREAFERLCNGHDSKTVARYFRDKGLLLLNSDGGLTKTEKVDGGPSTRFYVFAAPFLQGDPEQTSPPLQPVIP